MTIWINPIRMWLFPKSEMTLSLHSQHYRPSSQKKSTIPQWKQQQCLKRHHKINSQQLCSNRSSRPQSNINNKPYCKLETNHNPQPESLSFKTRQNMQGLSHQKQETHHLQGYRKGWSTFLPGIYFTNISWICTKKINNTPVKTTTMSQKAA